MTEPYPSDPECVSRREGILIIACLLVSALTFIVGYCVGSNSHAYGTALICNGSVTSVEYARYEGKWILFKVRGDRPRLMPPDKKCVIN
jgi:hypothetical protein